MSKIFAALIALSVATAVATPSFAYGPNDVPSTATEK